MLELVPLPAFRDNYIWLARGQDPHACLVVDPGAAEPVDSALAARGLRLAAILVTHHHADHTGGVAELAARHGAPVHGPAHEAGHLLTHVWQDGQSCPVPELGVAFTVLDVPGHTAGHIAFVGGGALFCGDTLFSAGCGRLFEGTAEELHASLTRLAALPGDTRVCCGHEYTQDNLRFAAQVLPDDPAIAAYAAEVATLRAADRPSLPSTIARERAVNPFLRVAEPGLQSALAGWSGSQPVGTVAAFAELRRWKDGFR